MLDKLPRSICWSVVRRCVRYAHPSEPFTDVRGQFYYVIPEIPVDTPAKNPLLQYETLPRLSSIKAEEIFTGVSKQIIEYQVALSQLSENIQNKSVPITYEDIVTKLEEIIFPVQYSLQLIEGLGSIHDDAIWRIIAGRLFTKFLHAQNEHLFVNASIYEALHTILLQLDPKDEKKRGAIEQLLSEAWSSAAGLSTVLSRGNDTNLKLFDCKSCSFQHVPVNTTVHQAKKKLAELQYLRGELVKVERAFERMVSSSAYVSTPDTMHKARFTGRFENATKIDAQLPNYLSNALAPNEPGQIPISESDLSASAPAWLPLALGGQLEGGYIKGMRVNLGIDSTSQLFLRHCSNREVRKVVWQALVQRAGVKNFGGSSGQHASNDDRIEQIRKLRFQISQQMGTSDWLHLTWNRSSTGGRGPETPLSLVDEVLEPLRKRLLPLGKMEWNVLNDWSIPYLRIPSGLDHFDIDYAIQQYNYFAIPSSNQSQTSDTRFERNLPMQMTLDRIFTVIGRLFDLSVVRLAPGQGHSAALQMPNSIVYQILHTVDSRALLGEVVVDLNPKQSFSVSAEAVKAVPLVTRFPNSAKSPSPICSKVSIAGLFGSLPIDAITTGLSELEALSIASAFGTCLQHVVSRTPSHSFTGLSTVMPGVSFAGSTGGIPVRDNFFLTHDLIHLLLISSNRLRHSVLGPNTTDSNFQATQPQQSSQNSKKAIFGVNRVVALPILRTLYESRFDLELWSSSSKNRHWQTVSDNLWSQHLPYGRYVHDQWPCSAVGMFGSRGIPGLRYSEIWRQLIAFDCISAFKEAGVEQDFESKEVKGLFKRYRETVLDVGTSISCRNAFRAFRGRDPLPTAFLNAIIPSSLSEKNHTPVEAVDIASPTA